MTTHRPGHLTVTQTARALGVTPEWVRRLTRKGQLSCVWTDQGRLIPLTAVIDQLRERQSHQNAKED